MTAIILTYYENRRKYLPKIIECLKANDPDQIIVFNQGEPIEDIAGVTVINSGKNFGCSVRHALALCIEDDHFFFQDDDLLIGKNTIATLLAHSTGDNVVGIEGSNLTDGWYTTAAQVLKCTAPVDIVTGRVHLCGKEALIRAFYVREWLKLKIWREDDILLSLANKGNMVVKCAPVVNLDEEGIGLSHEARHYSERNEICNRIYEALKEREH